MGVAMSVFKTLQQAGITGLLLLLLTSCYQPPFNNFKPFTGLPPKNDQNNLIRPYFGSQQTLIRELSRQDIQFVKYGDTMTLIVPTDRYFLFESPKLNQVCYAGLVNIVQLLKKYPDSTIYVAGFTDDIGSKFAKNHLTQARAEAMLTFLWANNIPAKFLHPEGYGSKYPVGDNNLIHGSAHNRRLEIQWFSNHTPHTCCIEEK